MVYNIILIMVLLCN